MIWPDMLVEVEKSEGVKKYKLVVTESSQQCNYSIGNIVININDYRQALITTYGTRQVVELSEVRVGWDHSVKYMII